MDYLWDKITEWLKEMLVGGITSNLSGMFDATNQKVAEISGEVGLTPQAWNASIFNMIQTLSETVIVPIAGAILAFVMTLELIQLITDRNNMNDVDTWMFFKWVFKTFCAVLIVTNTWNIVMGIFDVAQNVVNASAGVIIGGLSSRTDRTSSAICREGLRSTSKISEDSSVTTLGIPVFVSRPFTFMLTSSAPA